MQRSQSFQLCKAERCTADTQIKKSNFHFREVKLCQTSVRCRSRRHLSSPSNGMIRTHNRKWDAVELAKDEMTKDEMAKKLSFQKRSWQKFLVAI